MSSNAGVNTWVAGAFAGFSVNALVFPLDTLKTRLQSPLFRHHFTGIADHALYRNLYQGIGTLLLVTVPSSGVFFTTYEGLKYVLGGSSLPQPAVHALSSSVAQLINCAVITPAEVLKQNAQVMGSGSGGKEKASSSPTMTILRQMKRHPTSLWRGYSALAARDLPFTALQFPAYEYLKSVLIARRSRHGKSATGVFERAWISAVGAGVAGSAAAWITTPFDVVKTRMMLEAGARDEGKAARGPGNATMGNDGRVSKSGLQVGREVLQRDGVRGLFRGGLVRTVSTIMGNGLFIGCYEGAKVYLQGA